MTTYQLFKHLVGKELKYSDVVIFRHKGEEYKYRVTDDHLSATGRANEAIFFAVSKGIEKYSFASEAYGYKTEDGDWPTCESGDYAALTRLVLKLFTLCSNEIIIDDDGNIL